MTPDLTTKPWLELDDEVKKQVQLPRGMIGLEERLCLHFLARYCTDGQGSIVDAGAFIGASAYCLASGLAANERVNKRDGLIHSFDQFIVTEDYVGENISQTFRPIQSGDNFFDIFRWQTGDLKELIVPHQGDFLTQKWGDHQIDILFVDILQSTRLNAHLCQEFFPRLVPKKSIVVQQDFFHCWHPYIHITMEFLSDHFETVDPHVHFQSRVFQLISSPSQSALKRLANYDFLASERINLLDRFIEKEEGEYRAMARAVKLCQLWMDGDYEAYGTERYRLEQEFPSNEAGVHVYQVKQLDDLVAKREPCRFI